MKKLKLFRESLKLVWKSAPGWASLNVAMSVLRSVLPLALLFLIKILIDDITTAAAGASVTQFGPILLLIISVVIVFLMDEITSEFSNFIK